MKEVFTFPLVVLKRVGPSDADLLQNSLGHYASSMKMQLLVLVLFASGCVCVPLETHKVSGGETVTVQVPRGWPSAWFDAGQYTSSVYHEKECCIVEYASVFVQPALPPAKVVCYAFVVKWFGDDLPACVIVEDISDAETMVLISDTAPKFTGPTPVNAGILGWGLQEPGPIWRWAGSTDVPLDHPHLAWLQAHDDEVIRIYRFKGVTRSGKHFQFDEAATHSSNYMKLMRRQMSARSASQ